MMEEMEKAKMHLRDHVTYPATAEELNAACNDLSDFSAKDKKWFMANLPEGTYMSAEEVIKALHW